jgi:hypothetical protein
MGQLTLNNILKLGKLEECQLIALIHMKNHHNNSKNSIFLPLELYKPNTDILIPYTKIDIPIYENFVEVKSIEYMEFSISPEIDHHLATIQLKILLMQQRCLDQLLKNIIIDL